MCSLFVAVIVDNLARTQAAANATKPKPKAVKVELNLRPLHVLTSFLGMPFKRGAVPLILSMCPPMAYCLKQHPLYHPV